MSTRRCVLCAREFEPPAGDASNTACPDCHRAEWEAGQAALSQESAKSQSFPVTVALIAMNALVFAIMVLSGVSAFLPAPHQAIAFGADFGPLTLNGQWWRLVTSMFVHFGIIHIGLNMWCLWNLGRTSEILLGRFSFLLAYFASGIFGSIASVYRNPLGAGAGASGAIFGMAGVLVTFVYLKKTPAHLQINKKMLGSLGSFIFYNLIIGASIPGISNAAHVGGLVMGAVVGALLPAAGASESSRRTRFSFVVAFCAASLFASGAAAKHFRSSVAELPSIQRLIAQGKNDEAIAKLQEITAREPQFAAAHELLAKLYLSGGDYPKAISALEKANASDPSNTTYQHQLGSAYLAAKQFDQAAAFFQKLVRATLAIRAMTSVWAPPTWDCSNMTPPSPHLVKPWRSTRSLPHRNLPSARPRSKPDVSLTQKRPTSASSLNFPAIRAPAPALTPPRANLTDCIYWSDPLQKSEFLPHL